MGTPLSVAGMGGNFYSMPGNSHSGVAMIHSFIVARHIMSAWLSGQR
ncbi:MULTISPECIES: hypothetical protein [Pantoea]|uniref:Uncharacterized protein n=1 Tax=[Curtobacterium] plantarum TaxID=221276 RepID=A0ABT9T3W9_9GAMM|nr:MULTISPECIES: hypothetical protein [Pantoea]MDQ0018166.1 hypothetical protein [[Curtobacterium] plantarum]MDY0928774.1 hypothetical protein [Enterobacter sp. CFBP8995]